MEGQIPCEPTYMRNLKQTHRGRQWKVGPGARVGEWEIFGQGAQGLVTQDEQMWTLL